MGRLTQVALRRVQRDAWSIITHYSHPVILSPTTVILSPTTVILSLSKDGTLQTVTIQTYIMHTAAFAK